MGGAKSDLSAYCPVATGGSMVAEEIDEVSSRTAYINQKCSRFKGKNHSGTC